GAGRTTHHETVPQVFSPRFRTGETAMRPLAHMASVGLFLAGCAAAARAAEPDPAALAHKAQEVLRANCYRCHGQDGANEGGFNYAADLRLLISRKRVTPGDPAKSKLIKRMTNVSAPMPPIEEKVRPSADEIALLKKWIAAGAPVA